MSLKRAGVRAAALIPVSLVASCSEQDVGEAIENAIVNILGAIGKILLISLALMLVWAAIVAGGVALIALGLRRKRFDGGSIALVVPGIGLLVGAWPLVFTEDGLGGVLAPDSLPDASAGPLALQGLIAAGAVGLIMVVVQRRRARRTPSTSSVAPPSPAAPAPPPPPPPAGESSVRPTPARTRAKKRAAPKTKASSRDR